MMILMMVLMLVMLMTNDRGYNDDDDDDDDDDDVYLYTCIHVYMYVDGVSLQLLCQKALHRCFWGKHLTVHPSLNLPLVVGKTSPTALAAPVALGIILHAAARPPRQSFADTPSTVF